MERFPRDFFICHTTDDKSAVVNSLYRRLKAKGYTVWYDEAEITWGESITQKVNWGLENSRFVIVVLSTSFLSKHWPNRELNAALNVESSLGRVKVLPLLVGTSDERAHIVSRYPLLNDKRYLTWEDGDFISLDYEISRLSTVPRTQDRQVVEAATVSGLAASLDGARVSLSVSPLKSLATMQDMGLLVRASAIGSLKLNRATLRSLSVPHRQQASIGYLHTALSRLTNLLRGDRRSALLEVDGSILELESSATLLSGLADAYRVPRDRIAVLFDENDVCITFERSRNTLLAFSALGFGVGLSNFGEGYSSLGGIGTLGITHICVSDAFTREVGRDESDDALLATIASLSKAMGCRSIGSRVSSQRQLDVLKAANFDLAEVASEGHQTDP